MSHSLFPLSGAMSSQSPNFDASANASSSQHPPPGRTIYSNSASPVLGFNGNHNFSGGPFSSAPTSSSAPPPPLPTMPVPIPLGMGYGDLESMQTFFQAQLDAQEKRIKAYTKAQFQPVSAFFDSLSASHDTIIHAISTVLENQQKERAAREAEAASNLASFDMTNGGGGDELRMLLDEMKELKAQVVLLSDRADGQGQSSTGKKQPGSVLAATVTSKNGPEHVDHDAEGEPEPSVYGMSNLELEARVCSMDTDLIFWDSQKSRARLVWSA